MKYDILILGGGIAAFSAAAAAREQNSQCSIAILSAEAVPPYARPMLTKLPLAHYAVENTLVCQEKWFEERRIALHLNTEILSLDTASRTVTTSRGDYSYGACVYALGARNFIPPFPGYDLPGVHSIRTNRDIDALRRDTLGAKTAAVIGGGVIGLEAAYLLSEMGLRVTVLETAPYLMPRLLDEGSARYLQQRITAFEILTAVRVLGVSGEQRAQAVEMGGLPPAAADLVVISCGVRANAELAQKAGLAVERAIVVDEAMRTSQPEVFACGDCAQFQGINTALWAQARQEGSVAGTNAAGGSAVYSGSDMSLMLTCPEFSLYSTGDLGKDASRTYRETISEQSVPPAFSINPRPSTLYAHDFFVGEHLVGTFLLGDLRTMQERARRVV